MAANMPAAQSVDTNVSSEKRSLLRFMWKYKALYFLSLPGIIYFIIFKYVPLFGSIIAFQDYNIFNGIAGSKWVGLEHFRRMFAHYDFLNILKNTLLIGLYDLVLAFPAPIVLALLLNELRLVLYKRVLQTVVYMPHFLSWVIIGGIAVGVLSPSTGVVNQLISALGFDPVYFLGEESWIRTVLIGSGIWRDSGYGTIIYLAALAGINPDLYEAAEVDGANRWRQTISITIPALLPTIMILFLLHIGKFLDFGFERVFVFLNPLNKTNGEILDTYIYTVGLLGQQFSYTTAIGLFKSVVGLMLVVIGNYLSKKTTGESLY
ncbi:putative multiple-sugar transport system permease YteP [Paenibacillus solanacearum]|uniref:Multiple-sugar transport system permease YteP n=1 Tax=Paenibacillus solanacearum TaxID=2048548 RepID=A0A916JX93_9BACL|nr:ABC transporter permease subunit [Paenibacillus solanacearum]CAG7604626.1 putative multiple-sugar transport system permease YteP [Paenibacillus solanacearum]